VLAQCGAPVCAESFSFKPVRVYTSIRISDSLQDHTSYFMAELKRLSEIKENISSLQPSLVLIDEILRGTNSEDKYFGSAQFVKKLIQYNCLTLFATHDLKLSELENEFRGVIENYCFESIIKDDDLIFDYKVIKGVAQNKNASFLMKKMNII
jgi:DNA mismatch repair ATPase MutS